MKNASSAIVLMLLAITAFSQYKMRPVDEWINRKDPGWPILKKWIESATNKVEVLPVDTTKSKEVLYNIQVTTRSIMGAVIFSTGGMLIDNGWIRILGSGCSRMQWTLSDWNKGKSINEFGNRPPYLLIADDAAGGYFAVNYGLLPEGFDSVFYLSPDNLTWAPFGGNYEDFLWFCFTGNLSKFYTGIRWSSWQKDFQTLKPDEVFHILPPLWSAEGKDVEKSSRKPVPAGEQFFYNLSLRQSMGISP